MRIGILTFHGQQNYGGVLQAFALRRALCNQGHDVTIIDRWRSTSPWFVVPSYWTLIKQLVRMRIASFCGIIRQKRTVSFINRYLPMTSYSFREWQDAPRDLNVDLIVVGSDQVWHGGDWGDPRVYLLIGAPKIKAISYAASFGMLHVPVVLRSIYSEGLKNFSAISCREGSGVSICKSLGFDAQQVVDPTLLIPRQEWEMFSPRREACKLVCYLLGGLSQSSLKLLSDFSRENKCCVEVLCDSGQAFEFPHFKGVCLRLAAGPLEFLESVSSASFLLTDSFHAVMFASVYDVNVRVIYPSEPSRQLMFQRIEEFVRQAMSGDVICRDMRSALLSFAMGERVFFDYEEITEMRKLSSSWLAEVLR